VHIVYVSRELVPSLRCGGIGSYVWEIARQIVRRGHRVTVLCASDDTRRAGDLLSEGVRIIRLPGGDFAIRGVEPTGATPVTRHLRQVLRFRAYRQVVADYLDEIVLRQGVNIVEFAEYGNEAAEWIRRERRIPMVVRIHGPASRRGGRRIAWRPWRWLTYRRAFQEYQAVRVADALSCPSEAMAQLVRCDGSLGARPIDIIPNTVDIGFWARRDALTNRGAADGTVTIFSAGTVVAPKGIEELVEAASLLRLQGIKARLVIAGKLGPLGRSLQRQISRQPAVAAWFSLLGQIPRAQLRDHYRSADVVCFPSWWENCPCACLEAMASGGLVLGSPAGGMAEIIREGHDGFLCPPGNSPLLAERLMHVLALPPQEKLVLRANAQARIATAYDTHVIVPRMLAYYQQVIDTWRPRLQATRDCA